MTARVDMPRPVLEWAQRRGRRAPEAMRKRFRDWDRWLVGEARPTVNQAQDLAAFTHVPFGMLMLPEPPEEHLPIPDFRSGPEGHREPSQPRSFIDQGLVVVRRLCHRLRVDSGTGV